ncbi:MAG: tRNA pseudouridine(38-40) synthase TruA [Acidimicrobiales bacterium]
MSLFDQEEVEQGPAAPAQPSGTTDREAPARAATGVRVMMTIAYDGSGFHGFAANPGVRTVAGELSSAIARVVGHPVQLTCAGRTDSGVHAWGQVVHFDTPSQVDAAALQRSINKLLSPAVVVRSVGEAPPGFDARRSAVGRRYRYTVLNRPVPDPFLAATSWHVEDPLDIRAMALACDPLIGEHDWSSFCRRPPDDPATGATSLVRVVRETGWSDLGDGRLRFEIEASAFCHQMVRSLVGTLVAVGRGRFKAGDVAAILRAKDRKRSAEPAPPQGLCLWEVTYPSPE